MVLAGRSLVLAVVTLVAGGVAFALGFRWAFAVLLPGFSVAWFGTGSDWGGLIALLGVNVALWWVIWAAALWVGQRVWVRARAEPGTAADGPRL